MASAEEAALSQGNDADFKKATTWRKYVSFGVVCLAAFAGLASAIAHSNGIVVQAQSYTNITPTQMSYSINAAVAGLMAGPFLLVPFASLLGSSFMIFWSLVGMIVCGVWSASMTKSDQYVAFVLSRLFGGIFSSIPLVLGNRLIVNVFPLHQRGRAFALYSCFYTLGVVAGPTFDGFIVEHSMWPVEFWWTVGLQGVTLILVFVFLDQRYFDSPTARSYQRLRGPVIARRLTAYIGGYRPYEPLTWSNFLELYVVQIKIFFSPVGVLVGVFEMINFGWAVVQNTVLPLFLQMPVQEGGYGFTPQRNAFFQFDLWLSTLFAQLYSYLLNDRVPLRIAAKHADHVLKPEYRPYTTGFPGLITMPIGLGLFGASLQYHLHYMVIAVGAFLVNFSAVATVPAPLNYLVEAFPRYPQEVGTALNLWRLILGLSVPFFIAQWEGRVTVGWVFGMAAFFSIFGFLLICLVILKGHLIRQHSLI